MRRLLLVLLLASLAAPNVAAAASADLDLVLVGRGPALGSGGAEIPALNRAGTRAYVSNVASSTLDVYDLSQLASPRLVRQIPTGGGPNSVAVSEQLGRIAVAVEATPSTSPGEVVLFDLEGSEQRRITVDALPDSLTFTPDGRTLLVANEGEPADGVDPEGSVSVIDFTAGADAPVVVTRAGFAGVPLSGPVRVFTLGATVAQDLEPEFISVAPAGDVAYVSIQEANAIGILDLATRSFRVVRSMGFKDHGRSGNGLDASDRDGAINIRTYPNVFGVPQPDAIGAYRIGARTFLATANEGDSRGFEETRVGSTGAGSVPLDPTRFPAAVRASTALGRLTITNENRGDLDGDGDRDQIFAFGARSMSILDADARLRSDTGDGLEQLTAARQPLAFNSQGTAATFDTRSDNKGPEPEGLVIGSAFGRTYSFLGTERIGAIAAYDLSSFAGRARLAGYAPSTAADVAPEGLAFSPARPGRSNPILVVANEESGTLSVFAVRRG